MGAAHGIKSLCFNTLAKRLVLLKPFGALFGGQTLRASAARLYVQVVERAREPVFYARLEVPDTLDGRYEMIMLHAFLVLARLRAFPQAAPLAQALFDVFFQDMDRALREMGTGDLSVGKQVKFMAKSLYGRIAAYEGALSPAIPAEGTADPLLDALRRNLYGTVTPSDAVLATMAQYVRDEAMLLLDQPLRAFEQASITFGALPA